MPPLDWRVWRPCHSDFAPEHAIIVAVRAADSLVVLNRVGVDGVLYDAVKVGWEADWTTEATPAAP